MKSFEFYLGTILLSLSLLFAMSSNAVARDHDELFEAMMAPYANVSIAGFLATDNARVIGGKIPDSQWNKGVFGELTFGFRFFYLEADINLGLGNAWLSGWSNDKDSPDSAFTGHFFVDFGVVMPATVDSVKSFLEFMIGVGTIFSGKEEKREYSFIQPDGPNGHAAAFAFQFSVSYLFQVWYGDYIKIEVGPSFQYILGIKSMYDNKHYGDTYYHQILPGVTCLLLGYYRCVECRMMRTICVFERIMHNESIAMMKVAYRTLTHNFLKLALFSRFNTLTYVYITN